ncbi:MAG: fibronectin type III domain-containing protein [Bacteroidota bacterium]
MKALFLAMAILFIGPASMAQTVLINPNEEGGFENGTSFEANGWTVANDSPNGWVAGYGAKADGLRGGYVSNNSDFNLYTYGSVSISHFYRDVSFPAGETMILLKFTWRGKGEPNKAFMRVYLVETHVTPVAGAVLSSGLIGRTSYAHPFYGDQYRDEYIILDASNAGTVKRLVFTWENDANLSGPSGGGQPPTCVDNISLTTEGSIYSNGTGGGNLSDIATMLGEALGPDINVTIRAGDAVVVDADVSVKNLIVEPTAVVQFDLITNRSLTATQSVIVADGGTITSGTSGAGTHSLVINRDFFNNGTADFSTNAGAGSVNLEFNGSGDHRVFGSGVTDITLMTINTATSTAEVLIAPDNFTVQGLNTNAPGFLNLTQGVAHFGGNFSHEGVVFTTASSTVGTTSAFWLDNPNLTVQPQNGSLSVLGTLHVSGGVLYVGEDQEDCVFFGNGGTFIMEEGFVGVASAFGVASPSNRMKALITGGDLVVQRVGNSSTTFAGFDLGTSSLTNATSTGGSITIEQSNTALTGPGDFRVPFTFSATEGAALYLGNATTTAATTFRIRGVIPNLVVDPTRNHTVQLFQTATFAFPTTIRPEVTLDLNGNTLGLRGDLDITAGATLIGNATGSALSFSGSNPQLFKLDGDLVDGFVRSVVVSNSSGATPAVSFNNDFAVSNTLFLTNGSLGGSGVLTLGNPDFSSTFTLTRVIGSILTPPVFGPDVTFNINYNNSVVETVTGLELPSIVTGTLTINDPAGVYLNATTTVTTLSLSNGVLNTDDSRVIIVSGTSPSNIISTGTSFVSGPIVITLPANLDGSVDYPIPAGTTVKRGFKLAAPKTDPTPNTRVFFRSYDYFGGVPGDGISALPDGIRWFLTVLTGQGGGTVTETRVAFSDGGYGGGNEIAKSETIDGTYNSIGGSVLGTTITSDVFNSFSYFAVGLTDNTKSGVYTVGSGGDYATITAAVADLDTSALAGPVVLSLTDPSYTTSETFPIIIKQIAGANATNTLTIKPAAGISPLISGSNFDFVGLIKLEGADYVTIDGSNNGTDSRDMTITCTDFYNPVIWLSSQGAGLGAKNNTIKNLNLSGGLSQVSTNTGPHAIIGSGLTPISDGADNDSNKVHNNLITKVRYGVVFRGISGNPNEGNSVTNNYIGAATFGEDQIGKVGIGGMHQSGITISGNTIRSLGSIHPNVPDGAGDDRAGIALGGDEWPPTFFGTSAISNAVVTGNVIQDIVEESIQSAVGILIAATGSSTNNLIANNMISGVRANGTSGNYAAGIGYHSGQGDKVVFNSIRMEGDIDPSTSTAATGSNIGINVRGGSNLTVKNNIISADLASNTGTLEHYAITVPSSYNWGTGGLNYNDYSINTSNAQMKLGGIGSAVPYTPSADLTEWKTNFSAQQDANSKSFAPDFTSATDLHLNVASADANYAGTPISGVSTDIDGDTRGEGSPYIGADEVTAYPIIVAPVAPVLVLPADNATNQATIVELQWNPTPGATAYHVQVGLDVDFVSTIVDEPALPDTSLIVSSLENSSEYFWRVLASNTAGSGPYSPVFSFTTAPVAPTPPAAPSGLVITDSSSRTITIKWLKNAEPDFLRYRIYRGTSPGPTTLVDSTTGGIADTAKTLTGLTNGTRYYLRVTAVDSAGSESGYSNEVDAVPADRIKPAAPQNLVVTDSTSTQIIIAWSKNTEADFLKYMVYRGPAPNPTALVDSSSASIADTAKTFTGLVNGTRYYFRVTALDSARNESAYSNEVNAAPDVASGISDILHQIPTEYSLSQNYPNPFNPSTVIRYGIPERSSVKVEVFDMLGRRIALLVDLEQDAKYYEVIWNSDSPSGIYFYRIKAVAVADQGRVFEQIRKMVFVK